MLAKAEFLLQGMMQEDCVEDITHRKGLIGILVAHLLGIETEGVLFIEDPQLHLIIEKEGFLEAQFHSDQ